MTGIGVGSAPDLLALHAVRVMGMADAGSAAARYGLARDDVEDLLLDFEAMGWATRVPSTRPPAFSLTDAGRREDARRLATELDDAGARPVVDAVHGRFTELNPRFLAAATNWQIRPTRWDELAANTHDDWHWDERVLDELGRLGRLLDPLQVRLTGALARFDGYAQRYAAAYRRVEAGEPAWIDAPGVDSCHMVWFQLHEDLLATLGLERGEPR